MAPNQVVLSLFGFIAFFVLSTQALPFVAEPRTDAHFIKRHHLLLNRTSEHHATEEVIFLGASTMQNWEGNGHAVWKEHYEPRHAFNYGIGGDRTEHVLWRIEQGELDKVKAKLVVLCVGFNNVNHNDKPSDIAQGIKEIIKSLEVKIPLVKVLLVSILPSGHHNHVIHETNKLLALQENRRTVFYLDMTSYLEVSPEHVNTELFVPDQVHLKPAGYAIWAKAMEPLFAKLVGPERHPWIAQARNDAHHKARHQALVALSKAHGAQERAIFLGASSMEHWSLDGKTLWEAHYAPQHAYNYGINGDHTEHVLWRIEHGELDHVKAKLVVLIIGSNNVRAHDHPEDIAKGVQAIIKALEGKIPGVKVLLLSILPRGKYNHHVHLTNQLLAKLDNQKTVHYLDLTPHFEVSKEKINTKLYLADQLHLTLAGYEAWDKAMKPLFDKLIA